jgi:hypothetical protein
VTRKRPGYPDDRPFVERQRVSVDDALRAYAINGAYQLRAEDEIGSIEEWVSGRTSWSSPMASMRSSPSGFTPCPLS